MNNIQIKMLSIFMIEFVFPELILIRIKILI